MPHVIISGMPGIGKTTSVLCLARQLLGDSYKEAVLELNASDERGKTAVDSRPWTNADGETQVSMSSAIASRVLPRRRSPCPRAGTSS